MLISMTGFASTSCALKLNNGKTIAMAIEIKSVNSRFFEVVCKLPSSISYLEVKIINLLQKKLLRGRVFFTIRFENGADQLETIAPALNVAKSYVDAAKTLQEKLGLSGSLSIADILRLPDIFITEKSAFHADDEQAMLNYVDQVADLLTKAREEEGKTLSRDFDKIFTLCATKINEITEYFNVLMNKTKEEVKQQLTLSQSGDEAAKLRLEDLYSTLNKIDIHEEITRFNSHLASVKNFLPIAQIEKGKRLDFILQELLRETNTIMAKCSSFNISAVGVDIKVELEKAREQVQNII